MTEYEVDVDLSVKYELLITVEAESQDDARRRGGLEAKALHRDGGLVCELYSAKTKATKVLLKGGAE